RVRLDRVLDGEAADDRVVRRVHGAADRQANIATGRGETQRDLGVDVPGLGGRERLAVPALGRAGRRSCRGRLEELYQAGLERDDEPGSVLLGPILELDPDGLPRAEGAHRAPDRRAA